MTIRINLVALVLFLCFAPLPLQASNTCGTAQATTQAVKCPGVINSVATYQSAKADKGTAAFPIDLWGKCRYIDSTSADAYFIPFQTSSEWLSIIGHPPAGVTASPCARSATMAISPSGSCSASSQTVSLDYARVGVTASRSVTFTCPVPGNCNRGGQCGATQYWYQIATASYISLNSDSYSPSWGQTGISYTNTSIPSPAAAPPYCYQAASYSTTYYMGWAWCSGNGSSFWEPCGWASRDVPSSSNICGHGGGCSCPDGNVCGIYPSGGITWWGCEPNRRWIKCYETSPASSQVSYYTICE